MNGRPPPVIWITRPQPGAGRTAEALTRDGYAPFALPLTEIRACDPADGSITADAIAATSANAIRHAPEALVATLRDRPVYAVGDATAEAARARRFLSVASAGGAVDDLVAVIAARTDPGESVLYLCGRERTGDLEGKLAARGLSCHPVEVYFTNIVSYTTDYLADAMKRHNPRGVLFHSASAAREFARTTLPLLQQRTELPWFFTMSGRVADALPGTLRDRAIVAAAPTEAALLDAVRATLPISAF